jgi:hypothetical protein
MVREFNIYESIWSNHIRADVMIEDALALTTRLPIVGDETLSFQFRTPSESPNSFSYNWVQTQFYVSKLKEFNITKTRTAIYALELIPPSQFKNLTQTINIAYGPDLISNMASKVFQLLGLTGGGIGGIASAAASGNIVGTAAAIASTATGNPLGVEVEASTGQHQFTIPNMSPHETLNFLASEAQSAANKPSNYVFFQTHKQYFFCSVDYLIKKSQTIQNYYCFEQSLPNDPTNSSGTGSSTTSTSNGTDFRTMTGLRFRSLFDIEKGIIDGLYDNTVYAIDPVLQKFEKVKVGLYDHLVYNQQFGDFAHVGGNSGQIIAPNSKLMNLPGQSHQRMLITNRAQDSTYGTYPRKRQDFLPWLVSANAQLGATVLEFTIPGDSDRCAGDLINIYFQEVGGTDDVIGALNQYWTGTYLVTSVRHKYTYNAPMPYTTIIECVKNAFDATVSHSSASGSSSATSSTISAPTTPSNAPIS